ncbi:MAG: 16S rRNA (cytosine(1402)-N(4))-methyltransferase RsmH [Gammaproteobacteria bacterium]|nr:16S rRNA (cytosine(1402)-N(4))-methyltransferase RsmH [Gammaproteobacteria bacterium]
MSTNTHVPVLLHAAIEALSIRSDGCYVDATFGRGGHSAQILKRLGTAGRLLALDRDPTAVSHGQALFAQDQRFEMVQANFAELETVLRQRKLIGSVTGVLVDLGVSSPQLDVADRGFSFSKDGKLDMRMDTTQGQSAAEWLATVGEKDLIAVIKNYGEERYARRIAKAIVSARSESAIERTGQLADIVKAAHPRWEKHHHPATRTFQAIRIAINRELESLESLLLQIQNAIAVGGRVAIISFHSLEDRIVKRAFRKPVPDPAMPRGLPVPEAQHPWRLVVKRVRPEAAEIEANPRSRSAVLRVAERVI